MLALAGIGRTVTLELVKRGCHVFAIDILPNSLVELKSLAVRQTKFIKITLLIIRLFILCYNRRAILPFWIHSSLTSEESGLPCAPRSRTSSVVLRFNFSLTAPQSYSSKRWRIQRKAPSRSELPYSSKLSLISLFNLNFMFEYYKNVNYIMLIEFLTSTSRAWST